MVARRANSARNIRRKPHRSGKHFSGKKLRRTRFVASRADIRDLRYREGFEDGYREGVQSGFQNFRTVFEGTSIVIPTFNQLYMIKQCIDSIVENTASPYEIIVVDNASTDGTAAYLQSLNGLVRFRVLEQNRGFAGAINVGMMMAKGRTIMLLNNDTVVTEKWLDNLLACLNSDDKIGMVGPMTNYISGEQQINVPYTEIADMPKFAREYNRSNPALWRRIDRLAGFCLLFRRELFEGIGYFDEGFEIGNFEDDDYNVRVRLLGRSLVMAQDTFIHHIGSVSMRALGDRYEEVNEGNRLYYMEKWHNPNEWIHQVLQHEDSRQGVLPHSAVLYPEQIVVQAIGENRYWIEQGKRRPIEGELSVPAVRVSQIDLLRWPLGEPIVAKEAELRWSGSDMGSGGESGVVMLADGRSFHIERCRVREIVGVKAMESWNLHLKPKKTITQEFLDQKIRWLPVIAPPLIRQAL